MSAGFALLRFLVDTDRFYQHECISGFMGAMVMVDQLSIPALQSAELVFRRLEVIRQAHKASPRLCERWPVQEGCLWRGC